jgi:ribosome modulation factor
VADIIRIAGRRFWERYRASLTWPQVKVLLAIARCRTAALGGHLDFCTHCGYRTGISYNSCRNCPKCQTNAREKWLAKRQQELLPVNYFHLVFSVPHLLVPLMWQNKKILFSLLFDASAATLLEVAADPTEPALWRCPRCHGPMAVPERLTAVQLLDTEGRHERIVDSS